MLGDDLLWSREWANDCGFHRGDESEDAQRHGATTLDNAPMFNVCPLELAIQQRSLWRDDEGYSLQQMSGCLRRFAREGRSAFPPLILEDRGLVDRRKGREYSDLMEVISAIPEIVGKIDITPKELTRYLSQPEVMEGIFTEIRRRAE